MKILIIEDDLDTQEFLQKRLEEKCFAVDVASSGESGMRKFRDNNYDMVLLDYNLPHKNGFLIIQEVRNLEDESRRSIPIIMISVTNELLNKITALECGADDYIPKPFFFAELLARIQAILRRPKLQEPNALCVGNLTLDRNRQQVTHRGRLMLLTRKEFALLEHLMKNQGAIVSRSAISEHVWNTDLNPFSNTIETHILNLRKKLGIQESDKLIQSIPGRGYMIGTVKSS